MTTEPLLLENLVGERLQAIWDDYEGQDFCKHRFMAPCQLHPGALLFVGINPSYKEEDKDTQYYGYHEGSHPYFKSMKDLAEAVEKQLPDEVAMPVWAHLDLLYFRETQQAVLWDLIKTPAGLDFVWQQLQLFPKLLAAIKPSVVVIANTAARTLLGFDKDPTTNQNVWLDLAFEWDEELGTYRHNGVPFFFTSMLSGQRALDKGSRQRLEWHIRRALALPK